MAPSPRPGSASTPVSHSSDGDTGWSNFTERLVDLLRNENSMSGISDGNVVSNYADEWSDNDGNVSTTLPLSNSTDDDFMDRRLVAEWRGGAPSNSDDGDSWASYQLTRFLG